MYHLVWGICGKLALASPKSPPRGTSAVQRKGTEVQVGLMQGFNAATLTQQKAQLCNCVCARYIDEGKQKKLPVISHTEEHESRIQTCTHVKKHIFKEFQLFSLFSRKLYGMRDNTVCWESVRAGTSLTSVSVLLGSLE